MKLLIEEWGYENLSNNCYNILSESVMCFKIGAYRSAFMMSYLAFKQTLRERVINFNDCPYNCDKVEYDKFKNKIDKVQTWETLLNEHISKIGSVIKDKKLQAINYNYFNITDADTIAGYNYWKNIRNNCAHYNQQHIDNATVEQFWNYMMDTLPELNISGGKQYLCKQLCDIYKYYDIPSYKDTLQNVLKQASIVYGSEVYDLFDKLFEDIKVLYEIDINKREFWKAIIENQNLQVYLVKKLMDDAYRFVKFYEIFPICLTLAYGIDQTFIKDKLNEWLRSYGSRDGFWMLLCDLLTKRPMLVNIDFITRKNQILDSKLLITQEQVEILKQNNIFNKFLFNTYGQFFKVDYEDIVRDKYRLEIVLPLFEYVTWDKIVLEAFTNALIRLQYRIDNCSRNIWEKERMHLYEEVINENQININNDTKMLGIDVPSEFFKIWGNMV